jgi:hypothetical protein
MVSPTHLLVGERNINYEDFPSMLCPPVYFVRNHRSGFIEVALFEVVTAITYR